VSIFSDIAGTLAGANNQIFGDPARFLPAGSVPVEGCMVDVEYDVELQPEGYDSVVFERATTLEAMVSEVGEVERGDTFEVEGTTFNVRKILENDGVFVKVVVHAD